MGRESPFAAKGSCHSRSPTSGLARVDLDLQRMAGSEVEQPDAWPNDERQLAAEAEKQTLSRRNRLTLTSLKPPNAMTDSGDARLPSFHVSLDERILGFVFGPAPSPVLAEELD